jgi:small-conductance mechanosensitive channel
MPVPPSNPQDTQAAIAVLITITACFCVAYWRTALRIILIVVIAVTVFGAVAGIDGVTSLMAQHHR